MAIINNTLTEVGDVLNIKTQLSVRGDINLTGFTEKVNGITINRKFSKLFRFSKDSLNWSQWQLFTVENVQKIQGNIFGLLFLEINYERIGSDVTGILEFESLEILGNIELQICDKTSTIESIFSELADNDTITNELAGNLLRKIYYSGILPKFIDRGEEIEDEDFIAFWGAVCFFMALVISFGNDFDNILYNRKFLSEHLRQRGVKITNGEDTMSDLQFIANNFLDETRKRGTVRTFQDKEESVRGEWLRLLGKNYYDEFLLEVVDKKHMGYNIGNSFPLYNGTHFSKQLNKTEENSEDFKDLTKYDTLGNVEIVEGELKITGGATINGLGFDLQDSPIDVDRDKLITVDPDLDYEITFRVRRDTDLTGMFIKFGVIGYNKNGALTENPFVRIDNGVLEKVFLEEDVSDVAKISGEWYLVRGIIYAKDSKRISEKDARLNVRRGHNLRFNGAVEKIKICLYSDSIDTLKTFKIHDLGMRPLIRGRNILPDHKTGKPYIKNPQFIQQQNIVLTWMKNNNEDMSEENVVDFIESYLLPYQQKLEAIFLEPKVDDKQLLT